MLHHGDGPEAAHHGHADQLQPDVEPLHGGRAEEAAALVELQAPGVFFLEPAEGQRADRVTNKGRKRQSQTENADKTSQDWILGDFKSLIKNKTSFAVSASFLLSIIFYIVWLVYQATPKHSSDRVNRGETGSSLLFYG